MLKLKTDIENYSPNYNATICRVGEMEPIADSEHLCKTVINGFTMVISNDIHKGDIVAYFPLECALSEKFLSANNLYSLSEYERNANASEVHRLIRASVNEGEQGNDEEAKTLMAKAKARVGFFGKKGRVRIIKLRGVYSEGFIAGVSALEVYEPRLKGTDWNSLVGTSFNFVFDDNICWKYIPLELLKPEQSDGQSKSKKHQRKVEKLDRLVPGTYEVHYDTQMLNGNMDRFSPDDVITITVKVHGALGEFCRLPVKRMLTTWEKIKRFFGCKVAESEYGNIYSSHHVIKNRYLNPNASVGFYNFDLWGEVNKRIYPYLDEGVTVYGEIVGYLPGSETMVQKNHDYGCKVGQWKFMPYRMTRLNPDGSRYEYNVSEVLDATNMLIQNKPETEAWLMPITMLYHGKFGELYPDIDVNAADWREQVLERMKNDKEHFLMEELEPMCHLYETEANNAKKLLDDAIANNTSKKEIKVLEKKYNDIMSRRAPREGIVIRKDNDIIPEAFKLKTARHYEQARKQHDDGEVDIEEIS